MKRTFKRGLSVLLMVAMLLSIFPAEAFAVEDDEPIITTEETPTQSDDAAAGDTVTEPPEYTDNEPDEPIQAEGDVPLEPSDEEGDKPGDDMDKLSLATGSNASITFSGGTPSASATINLSGIGASGKMLVALVCSSLYKGVEGNSDYNTFSATTNNYHPDVKYSIDEFTKGISYRAPVFYAIVDNIAEGKDASDNNTITISSFDTKGGSGVASRDFQWLLQNKAQFGGEITYTALIGTNKGLFTEVPVTISTTTPVLSATGVNTSIAGNAANKEQTAYTVANVGDGTAKITSYELRDGEEASANLITTVSGVNFTLGGISVGDTIEYGGTEIKNVTLQTSVALSKSNLFKDDQNEKMYYVWIGYTGVSGGNVAYLKLPVIYFLKGRPSIEAEDYEVTVVRGKSKDINIPITNTASDTLATSVLNWNVESTDTNISIAAGAQPGNGSTVNPGENGNLKVSIGPFDTLEDRTAVIKATAKTTSASAPAYGYEYSINLKIHVVDVAELQGEDIVIDYDGTVKPVDFKLENILSGDARIMQVEFKAGKNTITHNPNGQDEAALIESITNATIAGKTANEHVKYNYNSWNSGSNAYATEKIIITYVDEENIDKACEVNVTIGRFANLSATPVTLTATAGDTNGDSQTSIVTNTNKDPLGTTYAAYMSAALYQDGNSTPLGKIDDIYTSLSDTLTLSGTIKQSADASKNDNVDITISGFGVISELDGQLVVDIPAKGTDELTVTAVAGKDATATSYSCTLKITYNDGCEGTKVTDVPITINVEAGITKYDHTVTVNKNGQPWTTNNADDGWLTDAFTAPTGVGLSLTSNSGATAPTISHTFTLGDNAEYSFNVEPGSYNVWVERGTGKWEKVNQTPVSVSATETSTDVNYYSATVVIEGHNETGYGITWNTAPTGICTDVTSDSTDPDTVLERLFCKIGSGTITSDPIKYTLTLPVGVEVDGTPTATNVTVSSGDNKTYKFDMPEKDAKIVHKVKASTYKYELQVNKNGQGWAGTEGVVTLTYDESGTTKTATTTTGTNASAGKYVWDLTHNVKYTLTITNSALYGGYSKDVTLTNALTETIKFYTVGVTPPASGATPKITRIGAYTNGTAWTANASDTVTSVIVPAGATVTLSKGLASGYKSTAWNKKVKDGTATSVASTGATMDYSINTDASAIDNDPNGQGVVFTPVLTWEVTVETKYNNAAQSTVIAMNGETYTAASHTFTGLTPGQDYPLTVNGFAVGSVSADNIPTKTVDLRKVTVNTQNVASDLVSGKVSVLTAAFNPSDATAPSAKIGTTNGGTVGSATEAYVPKGATGTLNVTTGNDSNRYKLRTDNMNWTLADGTTAGVTGGAYSVTNDTNDVTLYANYVPYWKITIANDPKRPGGAAITDAEASVTVAGAALKTDGSGATKDKYVEIANADGTTASFNIVGASDITGTKAANYVADIVTATGGITLPTATGTTAPYTYSVTASSDATVTPVLRLKPTITPDTITYDIGNGAKPAIVYKWTQNDAATTEPTAITATFTKAGGTAAGATITKDTHYTVSVASGVATVTFTDTFKASFEKGVYTFSYASMTGGVPTPLSTELEIASTARALTDAKIGEKVGGATTPTVVTHTQPGKTVEHVSHTAPEIRDQDLTWTWYHSATKPTVGTHAATPDAGWTEIKAAAVGTAGGNTYTVDNEDKGYYVFALVTASESGSGSVVTNSIAVDYEVTVKTVHGANPITVAQWGATVPKIQVNSTTAADYTDAFKFTVTPGESYTLKASPAADNNTLVTVASINETGAFAGNPATNSGWDAYSARTINIPYFKVTTGAVTVNNRTYAGKGFATGTNLFADDATPSTISAKVGSATVGYVLSGQDVTLSASDWVKDYKLQFKNGAADLGTAHAQKTAGATQTLSNITADANITGVLSLNLYDVTANVTGNGSLTEITMALTDGGKTYTFSTKSGTGKILGTKSQTDVNSVNAVGSVVFTLPNGTYAVDSTEGAGTTREGYRNGTTGTLTKTGYSRTVNGATAYYIVLKQTGLFLNVTDGYSGSFSPTAANTATAKSVAGTGADGTIARTVTVPYQFDEQTIRLTLANDKDSTGALESITVKAVDGNPTAPVLTVTAPTGIPATGLAVNTSNNTASLKIKDTDTHVAPGTYTYNIEISFTGDGNTPKVTYTLTVVVEEGKLINSTIKQNSDTATVANKQHAKVGDTLTFDNFVAQKLTNYNGTYGTATYTGGKTNFAETADYTYQWQWSANGAAATPTWTDIAGATNSTYTVVAGDENHDIRLLVKSAATGKLIENAPSAYVSVGYNAQVTVRVDGTAIANNDDNYTVVLHPNGVEANVTTGDVALTFKGAGVFSTNDSAALVRDTVYQVVVKNGTYATAKDTTLGSTFNISGANTSRTVDYYTVKYLGTIADDQRSHYVTGSGETFATDPAITAVVVGDSNKSIATGTTVLSGESVKFSTNWTQDYSIKWMQTHNGDNINDNAVEMTTALGGTKNENLTHIYNLKTNTIYATLTQKTYTVTGVVKDVDGGSVASITNVKLTGGSEGKTIVYTTGTAAAGEFNKNDSNKLGTGKHNGTVTFVVPKGDYTLNSTIGARTTFKGYSDQTKTSPDASFAGVKNVTANADRFRIYIQGENAAFKDITDKNHVLYFAYDTGIPAAQAVSSDFVNGGNTPITVTGFKVYKDGSTTALADLSGEPVTFDIPTLTDANKTLAVNNAASKLTVTIAPRVGQTNDTDATYRIEATGETPAGTTITKPFTYNFKVNPVTVASADIGGTAKLGEASPLSASYTVNPINQANATNNNTDQTAVTGKLTDADVGYAWFRSTNGSLTKTAFDYANKTLNGTNPIGTNSTYAVQDDDDGQFIYLVVYGKASAADTKDAANAYGYELTKIPVYYTGEITVKLDGTQVADANKYKVELREGTTVIGTEVKDGVYKSATPLDTTKTYTVWATRSTKEVGTPNWVNTGAVVKNDARNTAEVNYYTVNYTPDAAVTNNTHNITTLKTLTGPMKNAVSAKIEGPEVTLANTDAVLASTQVVFSYDKTVNDSNTGTKRQWSSETPDIRPEYVMNWTGSISGLETNVKFTDDAKMSKPWTANGVINPAVAAGLKQNVYDVTFTVQGGGTITSATLTPVADTAHAITVTRDVATGQSVIFSGIPAGQYTIVATPKAESLVTGYQYPGTTSLTGEMAVSGTSTGNILTEASTYTANWYMKGTEDDWSDKTADNSYTWANAFPYGKATTDSIVRRLYNDGNSDITNLKLPAGTPNFTVAYTKGGTNITTDVTTGTGITLTPGEYVEATITPNVVGRNVQDAAYSVALTATAAEISGSVTYTPAYRVDPAIIYQYNLSTIDQPVAGQPFDSAADTDGITAAVRNNTTTAAQALATLGNISWNASGNAAAGAEYTVTVVAIANGNHKFDATTAEGVVYTINSNTNTKAELSNGNRTLKLTLKFPATAPKVEVTAEATSGYDANATITATASVPQTLYYVVAKKDAAPDGKTTANIVAADILAPTGDWVVKSGHKDVATASGDKYKWDDLSWNDLTPGTEYVIYAVSQNTGTTVNSDKASAPFQTYYRVLVVTNPTTGAGRIDVPNVRPANDPHDPGQHVAYVKPGDSTNLTAVVTGANYEFKNWTETPDEGGISGGFGTASVATTTFTPQSNTTVTANFNGLPALEVTGQPGTTMITVNPPAGTKIDVLSDAKVTNVGNAGTAGNVKWIVAEKGAAWNSGSPTRPANVLFTVTEYTEKPLDYAPNADSSQTFSVEPTDYTKSDTAGTGKYEATVFFYIEGNTAVYDSIDVELTVAAAGAAVFDLTPHSHDLYLERLGKTPPTPPHTDWNVSITHNGYTKLEHVTIKSVPASGDSTMVNTEMAEALRKFTVSGDNATLELEEFVKSVAGNAKAGDQYTIEVELSKADTSTPSKAVLTLRFIDTTPHITKAEITTKTLDTDTLNTATASVTYSPTTYSADTNGKIGYQWYKIAPDKLVSGKAPGTWAEVGDNLHDTEAVWTWTPTDATALDNANGADTSSYSIQPKDAGYYLYVVTTGDEHGDYARNGAVSDPIYVRPSVSVVIDGQGNNYGSVSVGTQSTTSVNDPKKEYAGANGTIAINAAATDARYYFTGWTIDGSYDTAGVNLKRGSNTIKPIVDTTGATLANVTAHAAFDLLPTLTSNATFDTNGTATKVAFDYTKNDGSGNLKFEISGGGLGAAINITDKYDVGTNEVTLDKTWILTNLSSGKTYTITAYDMTKGATATPAGYTGYDPHVSLTITTGSYNVTAFTAVQPEGSQHAGEYLGTVEAVGGSGESKLDAPDGTSFKKVTAGDPVTLVARARDGYEFKQWETEGGTPEALTYTKIEGATDRYTFTPNKDVRIRAVFTPIDFEITSNPGTVLYAATSMSQLPTISAAAKSGKLQHFTFEVATKDEIDAATGLTWDTRDDAELPTWLTLSDTGAVTFAGPAAVGVNVESSATDSYTRATDELSVWIKVTSTETGIVHYKKLVVDVEPSQLTIVGKAGAGYQSSYVDDPVTPTGLTGVTGINNITPKTVSTPTDWSQVNPIEWKITKKADGTECGPDYKLPTGGGNYIFTANWNPTEPEEKYNYLSDSVEVLINASARNFALRYVPEETSPSTAAISSATKSSVYLDRVLGSDGGKYEVVLKNFLDPLYDVKVKVEGDAFKVQLEGGTSADTLDVGDMVAYAWKKIQFTPNDATTFFANSYAATGTPDATKYNIKLTASGNTKADGSGDTVTQTFNFVYTVSPKPISRVEIEKLDMSKLVVGDKVGYYEDKNPKFVDGKYSYEVDAGTNGAKQTQNLTDSLGDVRVGAGIADKYNQTPYSVVYNWNATTLTAGDSAKLTVTLEANKNYIFAAADGTSATEANTTYTFAYNTAESVRGVTKGDTTLVFEPNTFKPLLKYVDAQVNRPEIGSSPSAPTLGTLGRDAVGYDFGVKPGTDNTKYEWYVDGELMDPTDTDNYKFEEGKTYTLKVYIDRNRTSGDWVKDNAQTESTINSARLTIKTDDDLTNGVWHGAWTEDTAAGKAPAILTYNWTLQKVTPPPVGPVGPSTTYYEVNYIIVPGGNSPDPLTEEVEAGGYPEHVPHVTPNNNDEYQFIGWVLEDPTGKTIKEIVPDLLVKPETYKIERDTDFYAVYGLREIPVTYELGSFGKTDDPTKEIVARYAYPSFTPNVTIVDQYKDRAKFVGWSLEKPDHALVVNLVDPLTTQIINDTVFYAVYEIDEYDYHEHYMIGYPNGEFRPEGKITRAEVATIIARAVLPDFIEFNDYGDGGYSDVAGHWAQSGIAFCSNAGVFVGYEDGTFRPNKPITREEYALVIARIQGLTGCDDRFVMPFKDVDKVSGWALDGVYTCYDEGWIDGYEDENELGTYTFAPQRDIGRAEAAKIMNGYLNRGVDEAGVSSLNEYIQFPDVPSWYWGYWEVAEAVNDHYYYYYLEDEDGEDVPPEEWIVEAGYLNVKLDENDPDNTKNVRRSDPVYVNAN